MVHNYEYMQRAALLVDRNLVWLCRNFVIWKDACVIAFVFFAGATADDLARFEPCFLQLGVLAIFTAVKNVIALF